MRKIMAVLGGYVVMAVVVVAGLLLLGLACGVALEEQTPPLSYMLCALVVAFGAALAGGFCCRRIDKLGTGHTTLVLAGLILVVGVVSAFVEDMAAQPLWYRFGIPVLGSLGVLLGGGLLVNRAR